MSAPPSGYTPTSGGCVANDQSPVDLVRDRVDKCNRRCDFSIPPTVITTAKVSVDASKLFLSLTSLTPPPTAVYNDTLYQCTRIDVYGTCQHAYNGIYRQMEVVATFTNGSSTVMASIPVTSTNATGSPSTTFFNKFAGYTASPSAIPLGVSLASAVPSNMSYFVYSGRQFFGSCAPVTWIVYNQATSMSESDYGILQGVLTNKFQKRLQQLSAPGNPNERHLSYRDVKEENPAYSRQDGKVYMKCRRLNTSGVVAGETNRETFFGGSIEGLDNPPPQFNADLTAKPVVLATTTTPATQSGGVTATAKEEADNEFVMTVKNVWGSILRFFQGFGVLGAILMILEIWLAVRLQTDWRNTPENIFKVLIFIPNFIHTYLFSSSSPPK